MEEHLYHYRAEVQSVYDGDTCTLNIDLGLGTWLHGEKIRLARINTPELRGEERPEGLLAADFARKMLMPTGEPGQEVWISTQKDKKANTAVMWRTSGSKAVMASLLTLTTHWWKPGMRNMCSTKIIVS